MTVRKLDFRKPEDHAALFASAPVRSSAAHGWTDLYFERRDDSLFHTAEHAIDGHYLMVKLNPLSIAERRIDGKRHTEVQRRGSTAYVPSGCGHSVRYVRPLGSLCLMTLPEDTLREVADELGVARIAMAPAFAEAPDHFVLNAFETLDRELQDGNPHGALIGQTYARLVAAHILTCHGGAGARRDGRPAALTAARIQRLDEYIEARIACSIALEELARLAALSPFHFSRVFKAATGLSPYQYVLHKRIEFACALLRRGELAMDAIATACGFCDGAQFSRQFKKIRGIAPSAYRAGWREQVAWQRALPRVARP